MSLLVLFFLGGLLACAPGGSPPPKTATPAVSFARDIKPVLSAQCVFCHQTGGEQGGLNLERGSAYQNLVGVPSTQSPLLRVAPGDPEKSYLVHKVRGTHLQVGGLGQRMPFDREPLAEEQIDLISRWVREGALDN